MKRFLNTIFDHNTIIKSNVQSTRSNDIESSSHSNDSVSSIHNTGRGRTIVLDTLDQKSFNPREVSHRHESFDEVGFHLSQHSYHNDATKMKIYSEYQSSIIELQDNNNNNNYLKSADSMTNSSLTSPRLPRRIVVNSFQEHVNNANSSINSSNHKIMKDNQNVDAANINSAIDYDTFEIVSMNEYFQKILASINESKALFNHLPTSWTQVFDAFTSCIFSFIGIITLGLLDKYYTNTLTCGGIECILLIGAFGACAVLIFDCPESPVAQPRNVIGGFLVASVIGVLISTFNTHLWLKAALAVSLSIMAMRLFSVVHPPGGAAALIVVTTPLSSLRFHYVGLCIGGAVILVLLGIILNNLIKKRRYPLSL